MRGRKRDVGVYQRNLLNGTERKGEKKRPPTSINLTAASQLQSYATLTFVVEESQTEDKHKHNHTTETP